MKTKKEETYTSEMEEILDGIQDSIEDGVEAMRDGFGIVGKGLDRIITQFEKIREDIRQKRETVKPAEQNIPPHPEGLKKYVFSKWAVVALILLALIPSGIFYLLWAPERNASQILHSASKLFVMPETIAADALMVWNQDKSAVRRFNRLLRDREKSRDLKANFRAMNGNQIEWKVVDHLSIEPNWPDAGRVIIVHYINGQGQYRNAIVYSNGNIREFPGEKRIYYSSYEAIQKAKVLDGI